MAPERSRAIVELVGYKKQQGKIGLCIQDTIQSKFFVNVHKCAHVIERYYSYQCSLSYVSTELIICMSALILRSLSVMHNLKYSTCQNVK